MLHEDITERIIGAAINVHTALGPGLLESTYQACLSHEFMTTGLHFESQVALPVVYRDIRLDIGYRLDFVVEDVVIVEIKAVEKILPVHLAQSLSYLKLKPCSVGLLINFNVVHLRSGIRRVVNG
jgi:GxxExxY protein